MRRKQLTSVSTSLEGNWLKNLFKGKSQRDDQRVRSQAEMLSEAEIGRLQLQLQNLVKVEHELKLIQYNVGAAPSIWSTGVIYAKS